MSSTATENIRGVEEAIDAALKTLNSVEAPFTIWAPEDVRFALKQDYDEVTDKMVWAVWEAMPKSMLVDLHDEDWLAFEDAVDQGVQVAGI